MPEAKIGDRVTVDDTKYQGDGALVYVYGQTMIVRDPYNEYHRGLSVSSVTGVESTLRLRREKFMQAFEEIISPGEMTLTVVNSEVPGALAYFKPDSESSINFIQIPAAIDNKELWLVVSFNKRMKLEIPETTSPKDIEIRHVRPFEIKHDILDDEGVLVGRDFDKEQVALCDRMELILNSLVMQALKPLRDTRAKCLSHLEKFLGSAPTWVFDGEDMLDALPEQPGLYLCGYKGTGRVFKLHGTDQICLYADSRFSQVIKVMHE